MLSISKITRTTGSDYAETSQVLTLEINSDVLNEYGITNQSIDDIADMSEKIMASLEYIVPILLKSMISKEDFYINISSGHAYSEKE